MQPAHATHSTLGADAPKHNPRLHASVSIPPWLKRRAPRALRFAVLVWGLALGVASAVPDFDPFADATASGGTAYAVGSNLVGQRNSSLSGAWYLRGGSFGSTQPTIVAGNLSYPDSWAASGNSVAFAPANSMSACLDLNVAVGHADTVYYSFLLKITDLSAVPTYPTNNPIAAFLDDPSLSFSTSQIGRLGSRLLTKKVGSGYVLGISKSANAADFAYEPDAAAHNLNDVLFVVASYQRVAGVQTNVVLWVNPPASSFGSNQPPAPTVVATSGNTALNNNSARAFGILCQFLSAPGGVIDDVRASTNDWAYVTGGDPAILTQPLSQTLPEGANASFTVTARGTPTLTYQWYLNGTTPLSDDGRIQGATTATLTINNISSSDTGDYTVTVLNGLSSSVTSSSAHLALTDPRITSQPQSSTNNFGTTATFSVTATGTGTLQYRWHKVGFGDLSDGGNIIGSSSNVLAITGVSLADAGTYWVTVTNGLGTAADSLPAQLTVLDPYFVTQPSSTTNVAGADVTFHVVVDGSGAPSFTYMWRLNGNLIFDNGHYAGTSTDTLTIHGITGADQGNYSVEVIGASTIDSADASLSVLTPVMITVPPNPRTVAAGSRATFAVAASGSQPFSYQWQAHGTNLPGATTFAYTVTNAQAADAGVYTVVISNVAGAATNSANLDVEPSLYLASTNLVVIRIGDGAQPLSLNGNSIFLDQFKPDGTYVSTINIPDDGASAMTAIGLDNVNGVNSGSTTGSSLTRSLDQRFMVIAGYNTNLSYGASLVNSSASSVPRGVGLVDSYAQYTRPVSSTDTNETATYWRGAVTDGTNNFWGVSGISGTYYLGYDAPPLSIQTSFLNSRSVALFNGDIYCAGAVAGATGVLKISGMPTNTTTPTVLFAGSSGTYNLVVSPNGNLIYVVDQRAVANGGGVQRWDFDGSNWNLSYTLTAGFGNLGPRYVTADFSGPNPVLYVTSNDQSLDNNRIIMVQDTGSGASGVTLAHAGVNQTLRGLAFGPVQNYSPPQPLLSGARQGNDLVLTWTGAYTLQSAHDVTGSYSDVQGATSPYTNSLSATDRVFFRLRN